MIPAIISVKRKWFTDKSTIGLLNFDYFSAYTLEDTVRKGTKIAGQTAIPAGRYEVVCTYSNRFQKLLPLLLNVPGFEGVRIHSGNRPEDTEGCILVGKNYDKDFPDIVTDSRMAFKGLFELIKKETLINKVYLEIS